MSVFYHYICDKFCKFVTPLSTTVELNQSENETICFVHKYIHRPGCMLVCSCIQMEKK
jgi:hypothetical protein